VVAVSTRTFLRPVHPVHAILLAFPFPLFLGALVGDLAYWSTFNVQWANFSSWLIAGALLVGAFAVLWGLVDVFRIGTTHNKRPAIYFAVLLAMWMFGLVNALIHARDAWATMPEGLLLSAVTAVLALVASWIGYSGVRTGSVE